MDALIDASLQFIWYVFPVVAPVILGMAAFHIWVDYRRRGFIVSQKYSVLEFKLPKEIMKTPASMELALIALHQVGGEATWLDRSWYGKVRPWFSLELISTEGNVRFLIWTRDNFKKHIQNAFYAQYPGIEITEVPDYTRGISYEPGVNECWGCEFGLTKPDPYPIKTYVDYKLDDSMKEEEGKVDPMTQVIEFFGSLEKGNHAWLQIIVRSYKDKKDRWGDVAKSEIEKIIAKKKTETGQAPLTKDEEETILALRRSVSKIPFEVGIRGIYWADKESFNPSNIGGLVGSFKQYNSGSLNGFKPKGGLIVISYPWQDIGKRASNFIKKMLFQAYKMRMYFYFPFQQKGFVLNTEELATIFHFPGKVSATPNLRRIPSKKAEPPPNLPI